MRLEVNSDVNLGAMEHPGLDGGPIVKVSEDGCLRKDGYNAEPHCSLGGDGRRLGLVAVSNGWRWDASKACNLLHRARPLYAMGETFLRPPLFESGPQQSMLMQPTKQNTSKALKGSM